MRVVNLDVDAMARKKMTVWRCTATGNDDGTWTYTVDAGRSSMALSHNIRAVSGVFIVDVKSGDLDSLSSENKQAFPVIGTRQGRYRAYQIASGSKVMLYANDTPFNPVGFAVLDQTAFDLLDAADLPLTFAATDHSY